MKFATHASRGAAQALPTLSEYQEVEDMDAVLSRAIIRPSSSSGLIRIYLYDIACLILIFIIFSAVFMIVIAIAG